MRLSEADPSGSCAPPSWISGRSANPLAWCAHASCEGVHAMTAVPSPTAPNAADTAQLLRTLGVADASFTRGDLAVRSPINGAEIARVPTLARGDVARAAAEAHAAFLAWRGVPAPRRGELVRCLGEQLRAHKDALGRLVSIEA